MQNNKEQQDKGSIRKESTDVLIVGGGAAAGRAAVEASKYGVKVVLVDKGKFGRSGSSPFATAMSVSFPNEVDRNNNWERFVDDVVQSGCGLANPALAAIMAQESVPRFHDLEAFGGRFQRLRHEQTARVRAMGQSIPRSHPIDFRIGDYPLVLRKEALRRGVKTYEGVMITRLLTNKSGAACGAMGVSSQGERYLFAAKTVVLACGSATKLYPFSSPAFRTTGDAMALGLRAGATAVDCEFTELTLTPVLNGLPLSSGGIGVMVRWGAKYLNSKGERFMERYDPVNLEAANRAKVVEAVYQEIQAGRGPVICDFREISKEKMEEKQGRENPVLAHKRRFVEALGYFPWAIVIHRLLGGLAVDEFGQTMVGNLFAIGESAGGIHGAARVAGNAVLETQVFGARAGSQAARIAARQHRMVSLPEDQIEAETQNLNRLLAPSETSSTAAHITDAVQQTMDQHVNVFRTEEGLTRAVSKLEELRKESDERLRDPNIIAALEARNLALVGEMVAKAALLRRETRGCHRRADFPWTDNEHWQKHIGIRLERDGELHLSGLPV